MLSDTDIFVLWAKPLLDNRFERNELLARIGEIKLFGIETSVKHYCSQSTGIQNLKLNDLSSDSG